MSIGMPSYCAGASQVIGSSEPAGYTEKKLIVNNKGVKMPDDGLAYELLRENRSLMLSLHDSEKNVAALKVEMKRINDAQGECQNFCV